MTKQHDPGTFEQSREYLEKALGCVQTVDDIANYIKEGRLISCVDSISARGYIYLSSEEAAAILKGRSINALMGFSSPDDARANINHQFVGSGGEIFFAKHLRIGLSELDRFIETQGREPASN